MRFTFSILTLLIFTLPLQIVCGKEPISTRPNIVLIVADNMGWQDTSLPLWNNISTRYNKAYSTPNIERLAQGGVKFSRAYSNQVSSPSNVTLLTGVNSAVHRVTGWITNQNEAKDDKEYDKLILPNWNINGLQPYGSAVKHSYTATLLPQLLQKNGYKTIHCGKTGYGSFGTPGASPKNLYYDLTVMSHIEDYIDSYIEAEKIHDNQYRPIPHSIHSKYIPKGDRLKGHSITQQLTDSTLWALDSIRSLGNPFFLHLSHYAIHPALYRESQPLQKFIDRGLGYSEAHCAVLAEEIDNSLARLINYLDHHHLTDNTIIIFISENGGFNLNLEAEGLSPNIHNYPLNAGKGSVLEGGVRVPMVIRMPYRTSLTECNVPVHIADLFPTILDMAGIEKYRTKQKLDGVSILPFLGQSGAVNPSGFKRALYWHFPNKWGGKKTDLPGRGYGATSSIIYRDWKLVYYYENGKTEFFNLKDDIFEIVNQADNSDITDIRKKLADDLTRYLRRVKAQLPKRPDGKECKYPNGTNHYADW